MPPIDCYQSFGYSIFRHLLQKQVLPPQGRFFGDAGADRAVHPSSAHGPHHRHLRHECENARNGMGIRLPHGAADPGHHRCGRVFLFEMAQVALGHTDLPVFPRLFNAPTLPKPSAAKTGCPTPTVQLGTPPLGVLPLCTVAKLSGLDSAT